MTEQAILNRIHKLEARQKDNKRIINKLIRKLKKFESAKEGELHEVMA